MKKFVNLYILLFILDGLFSLTNALTAHVWGVQPLYLLQNIVAFSVLVLSCPLYLLICSMRHFPKRVILPMIIFIVWAGLFFALPLPIFLGVGDTMLFLSILQPCLGVALLFVLRCSARNDYWLYAHSDFARMVFKWKQLLGLAVAHVLLILPLIGVWLAVSLSLAVSHLSSGFIHLGFGGVSVEARTYSYDNKRILLLPTVHMAKPAFYERLIEPLPTESTVVIPEGVTDEQQLLKEPVDYGELAQRMGLEAQDNQTIVAQRHTAFCDVDVSEFSPGTIDYLRTCFKISKHLSAGNHLMALQTCASVSNPNLDQLWEDLLDLRNRRVTDCVTDCLQTYDTVVIPWGAAHMPGIQRTLLKWGAAITERRRVPVWYFSSQDRTAAQAPDTDKHI